ncbi:uncharacterized protein AC631_00873 [Debaryomyces fabryi]|uniref:Ubiquinone biosynthesis protein n=1 Tax=Debaryomyces fabryi TaxID=58627 RepID=A0A0V1Q4Q3_9ASCO|nr:uncharacterized protein AC631_00873 [Debaryomyces fabryi]KSA03388.1 hypothetical protein AC631_00873 [Debaryomyces fabryi]CUM49991.1 unnamed protein product [Debaryomyces fabryi]
MFKSIIRPAVKPSYMTRRAYHSIDHPSSNIIVNPKSMESIILTKSLTYLPKFGFDSLCITHAIRDLKYPDSLQSALSSAPSGNSLEFQLMLHWLKIQRQTLQDHVLDPKSQFNTINDEYERVIYLINKRLEYNQPIIDKLSSGLSQLIAPYNINQSLDELHNLSDDIAFYAGDTSNDFAWYSKRLGFSSIYVSSEVFMLQDTSEDFQHTKKFVEDKVQAFSNLGGAYNDVEQWGTFNAISLVNLIKSQLARG